MGKRLEITAIVVLAAMVVAGTHLYHVFFTPPSYDGDGAPRVVDIPRGTSFRVIADSLERNGVVRDADEFMLAARLMGAQKDVKAGEYEFTNTMTPVEVLSALVEGEVKKHFVTIPEGYSVADIASVLDAEGIVDGGEFAAAARDPGLARRLTGGLGAGADTLEGYLFPDSYLFTKGMEPEEIIGAMVARFEAVYDDGLRELAERRGMDTNEVVTLASIIEKETGAPAERKLISAVFHNRLTKRIRLRSDPTVIYGIENFDGNLTRRHLRERTPYNTYVNYGLPPGPIANPGRASLEAAVDPAEADFLYFVSRNDGTHHFSRTLAEHNRAVRRFQKNFSASRR